MSLPAPIQMFGLPMHPMTMDQTVAEIFGRMDAGLVTQHVVVNVAKLVQAQTDVDLRRAIDSCDIINIDGMGVVGGARLLGLDVPERVAGIDLFFRLLYSAQDREERIFLLGATQAIIERTNEILLQQFPRLIIAGYHHGYFWEDEEAVVDTIRASNATMLFVAVTSPKKEQFIARWRDRLGVKFAMGVGGTFDIVAGKTKRAPKWMQRHGLEWFYRLIQEPGRMWRRYMVSNSIFLFMLLEERLRRTL